MKRPVGLASPLYLFRDIAEKELFQILEKIKGIGFDGVEFVGFFGHRPEEVRDKLRELDLAPVCDNIPMYDFLKDPDKIIVEHQLVGFPYLAVGGLRPEHLPGGDRFFETVEWYTSLGRRCRDVGITLVYHNHDFELRKKIGTDTHLELLLDSIPADALALQPDLGWMQIGGGDPIFFLKKYRDRCPIVHVKDFYTIDREKIGDPFDLHDQRGGQERGNFEFRPCGFGISNIPMQMPYIDACAPDWILTDQDCAYDRDRFDDLALGLRYMRAQLSIYG